MAFFPAHCDNNCKGCSQNICGWCCLFDIPTPEYKTVTYTAESKDKNWTMVSEEAETAR